jgi:hypothetical protein
VWNQRTNGGRPVPPGTYTVRAVVTADGLRSELRMEDRFDIIR